MVRKEILPTEMTKISCSNRRYMNKSIMVKVVRGKEFQDFSHKNSDKIGFFVIKSFTESGYQKI